MADIAPASARAAFGLARVLADHKGGEVVVLDVSLQAGWTDFFVIATATSSAHMRGLARFVDEGAAAEGLSRRGRGSVAEDEEWALVDYGELVVHIMTARARAFYELEKLWFQSPAIRIESDQAGAGTAAIPDPPQ